MANSTANVDRHPWWVSAVLVGGVMSAVMLPMGALGTRFGVWEFGLGFMLAAGALLLAVLCGAGGLIALAVSFIRGQSRGRGALLFGTALCLMVVTVLGINASQAFRVPPIHDISTDIVSPPMFSDAMMAARANANPVERSAELDRVQSDGYPDLNGLDTTLTTEEAYRLALSLVNEFGWELVSADVDRGIIEATDRTFWFGFRDDVVVRIVAKGNGSRLDVRSVSRVGQGDVGANAARIKRLLARIASA